jgi:hypothetical protein
MVMNGGRNDTLGGDGGVRSLAGNDTMVMTGGEIA